MWSPCRRIPRTGRKRQVEQFVTINREGKNVPTSLYLDLLKLLPLKKPADAARERATDIGTKLRKEEGSPFFERIVVTVSPKKGQISLTNFVRKVSPYVGEKGTLFVYTLQEQSAVISNYFSGLRQIFPKEFDKTESIFFKTVGFGALWNVFPTFFNLTLKNQLGFSVQDVAAVFKRIETFDFAAWTQYGTGNQAEINAGKDIEAELQIAFNATDGGIHPIVGQDVLATEMAELWQGDWKRFVSRGWETFRYSRAWERQRIRDLRILLPS